MTEHGPAPAPTSDDALPPKSLGELDLPDRLLGEIADAPDRADELVMEFAADLDRAGHGERARRLLESVCVPTSAPQDHPYCLVELARILRRSPDARDTAEAERITSELLRPGRLGEGPAWLLGEELRELERWEEALRCYNVAARHLLAAPPEDLAEEDDLSLSPIVSRLLARMKLGLAPDAHDDVAMTVAQRQAEEALGLFGDEEEDRHEQDEREVVALYSREAFDDARARGLLTGGAAGHGADAYYRAAERSLRERSREHPATRWSVVLHGVEEIAEFAERRGTDPAEGGTALDWADLEPAGDDPRLRAWPPGRNEACWCASGRKYKKCCGAPSNR